MKFNRQYKYLIKPNFYQQKIIIRNFGAARFVYNRFLDDIKNGRNKNRLGKDIIREYVKSYPFLNEADSSALMNAIFQAQDKIDILKNYKKRGSSYESYTTANLYKREIYIVDDKYINIVMLGLVEIVYHRPLPEDSKIKRVTISRDPDGRYYACILIEREQVNPAKKIDFTNSVGFDYSNAHLIIDDKGNKLDMPHFYGRSEDRISKQISKLKKMVPKSQNYYRQKAKIAGLYKKMKNQRDDFLHKLSKQMADTYDVICVESLYLKEISKHYNLGKRTYDNAYRHFLRMLDYKMKERGKLLLYADQYFASSKICSVCGKINYKLELSERQWKCPDCKSILDRDVNAAINIKRRCIEDYMNRRVSG